MACWHSFSMQLRCSRSYSPIRDGKTLIMSSIMSRTQCEHLRSPDRSDLGLRPRCIFWLISHTLRALALPIIQWPFLKHIQLQRVFKEGHSQVWHNCRFLVLQERFWESCTESADGFCGTEVCTLRTSVFCRFYVKVRNSALGWAISSTLWNLLYLLFPCLLTFSGWVRSF